MISKKLSSYFPFLAKYFSLYFEDGDKKFPQSIVFEGLDPYAQCFFALELARNLNCLEDSREDCNCLNCRWIRENKHPAINFVSQIHFKPQEDETKTVISALQAKAIEKSLRETSDYHRFFIFFDAKNAPLNDNQLKSLERYSPELYDICPDKDWSINHINSKTFNPLTPNILLKSIEEPPERTTFVFLTKNRSDLINTIVSRSQCFRVPSPVQKNDISNISWVFEKYPNMTLEDAFSLSESLKSYIAENGVDCDFILDSILAYLINELKTASDFNYIQKLKCDIENVSMAKRHLAASMLDKIVFDTLFLKFARGVK